MQMISGHQTVAEIAASSMAAVRVLERHGIDYCSSAKLSLHDVCAERDIPLEDVVCELSAAEERPPDERDWTSTPLPELIRFLVEDDHEFLRTELPLLEERMLRVVMTYAAEHPQLAHLPVAFRNLRTELESHMDHEEKQLFPAIMRHQEALEAGEPVKGSPLAAFGGPLRVMESEHETAGAALRLMREFCQNYSIPDDACVRYRALIDGLCDLEDRLLRHMYLENNILVPRAAALKQR